MNFKAFIGYGLSALLAGCLIFGFFNYKNLEKKVDIYKARILQNALLYVDANGVASRLAMENQDITASNDSLNKVIGHNKEQIRSLVALTGQLSDSLNNVETAHDTIYINNVATEVQKFNVAQNGFELKGYFEINSPFRITFEKMLAEINLEIVLTETKDRLWTAYVTTPNTNFLVSDVVPKINPYEPTFFEKLSFSGGLYASSNRVGLSAGVTYDTHHIKLLLDNYGGAIGYEKTFKIRR